jgi:hypothetical protein
MALLPEETVAIERICRMLGYFRAADNRKRRAAPAELRKLRFRITMGKPRAQFLEH